MDVWANQEIFTLDRDTLRPTHVAGVPPDYFSDTGQRWGNPLYDWQNDNERVTGKTDKLVVGKRLPTCLPWWI